jgi:hypothetical protein
MVLLAQYESTGILPFLPITPPISTSTPASSKRISNINSHAIDALITGAE